MAPAHAPMDIGEQLAPLFLCDALQENYVGTSTVQLPIHQGIVLCLSRYLLSCGIIIGDGFITQVGPNWIRLGCHPWIKHNDHMVVTIGLHLVGFPSRRCFGHPACAQGIPFVLDEDRDDRS